MEVRLTVNEIVAGSSPVAQPNACEESGETDLQSLIVRGGRFHGLSTSRISYV